MGPAEHHHASAPELDATTTAHEAGDHETASRGEGSPRRVALRYVSTTGLLMAGLYAVLYHPWSPTSLPGEGLKRYLEVIAASSAMVLRLLGEPVSRQAAIVSGRFSYSVVVDCGALDVQALFVAAVLAFPSSWRARAVGLLGGVLAIFAVNIVRLVVLYYAGAESLGLFKTLHEEVFVLLLIAFVCGMFLLWARWAIAVPKPGLRPPPNTTPSPLGQA